MGQAVELAVKSLNERKELYNQSGIQYYQPMLVLMTDGFATDDTSGSIKLVKELCNNRKLTVVNIAIGNSADLDTLKKFHPDNEVTTINKLEMKDITQNFGTLYYPKSALVFYQNDERNKDTYVEYFDMDKNSLDQVIVEWLDEKEDKPHGKVTSMKWLTLHRSKWTILFTKLRLLP